MTSARDPSVVLLLLFCAAAVAHGTAPGNLAGNDAKLRKMMEWGQWHKDNLEELGINVDDVAESAVNATVNKAADVASGAADKLATDAKDAITEKTEKVNEYLNGTDAGDIKDGVMDDARDVKDKVIGKAEEVKDKVAAEAEEWKGGLIYEAAQKTFSSGASRDKLCFYCLVAIWSIISMFAFSSW